MLKPQQRQTFAGGFRSFVATICDTTSATFGLRRLFRRTFLRILRGCQLGGCRELLSLQPQSHEKVEKHVCLVVLHTHRAAHFQRLLLQPDSGHGNKDDEHQSCGESKVHDKPWKRCNVLQKRAAESPANSGTARGSCSLVIYRTSAGYGTTWTSAASAGSARINPAFSLFGSFTTD